MSLALPFNLWPEADRRMWSALFADGGPLDDLGPFGHLRATTQRMMSGHYGRWLGWVATATDCLNFDPAERATLSALHAWVEDLSNVGTVSRHIFVSNLVRVLGGAFPDHDWSEHDRLVVRLQRLAGRGDQRRKSGRVLSSAVLFDAGMKYASTSAQLAKTELAVMKRRRSGTMVAMLTLLPMRRRAFAELRLGSSILIDANRLTVLLSPEMTKTGSSWEAEVPLQVADLLWDYIRVVRPWFLLRHGTSHDFLWVNDHGRPFQATHMSDKIGKTTKLLTGQTIRTHLFRDAAATTLSVESPSSAKLIAPLLGHLHSGTAERHYIRADSINAGRHLATALNRRRNEE